MLDDPAPTPPLAPPAPVQGSVYTDVNFQVGFQQAFDVLYSAMLGQQVPRIELMISTMVPIGVTELTPADMGLADFGDYIFLRERTFGSTDKYLDMLSVDVLSQRAPTTRLIEYNWRNNTFYFIGATNNIDLEVKYDYSGEAPTDDDAQVGVDASLNFLSNYSAGVCSRSKGDWEDIGKFCMELAVGPKFSYGEIGGFLRELIAPLARSRQKVQIAPKPYTTQRRYQVRRAIPWVAAQSGTTGGGSQNVPVQVSTSTSTLAGAVDGVNATYVVTFGVRSIELVTRNGVTYTAGVDYTVLGNSFTFMSTAIPQPGDIVTAEVFPLSSP